MSRYPELPIDEKTEKTLVFHFTDDNELTEYYSLTVPYSRALELEQSHRIVPFTKQRVLQLGFKRVRQTLWEKMGHKLWRDPERETVFLNYLVMPANEKIYFERHELDAINELLDCIECNQSLIEIDLEHIAEIRGILKKQSN